ncbi:MAG: secondary thiamine-phosphate synthase enzyme YjbQ [Candidatus Aenigmatarchaeota archaeon]
MKIYREEIEIATREGIDVLDITKDIELAVRNSKVKNGICHIFLKATTAGLIINEYDLLLVQDAKNLIKNLVKEEKVYAHPQNAFSHLRAMLTKCDLSIPISENKLCLGTWQRIWLVEFDTHPRKRKIIVSILENEEDFVGFE